MSPIIRYLKEGKLPKERNEARNVQIRAARFVIIDDVLYRHGHSLLYLQCANKEEYNYELQEVKEEICGNHTGTRSLAGKALRAGYYWPMLQKDAYDLVQACD